MRPLIAHPPAQPPTQSWPRRPVARRAAWLALTLAVMLLHGLAMEQLGEAQIGWGMGTQAPPRIAVSFVKELAQAAPTPPPAPAQRRHSGRSALPAGPAASAPGPQPLPAAPTPAEPAEPAAEAAAVAQVELAQAAPVATELAPAAPLAAPPAATLPQPALPPVAGSAGASSPTESSAAADFSWPPSTRLRFKLLGHYRGPLHGSAQVDWLLDGSRYQVHLETSLGPVLSRHITSQGLLTPQGLAPQRFDGEQSLLFRATRRWGQRFTPERITLADGRDVAALPGTQDEASQFVQLTWLFTTQPELLQVGKSVELPLALNRRVDLWTYDVVGLETLQLPFGQVSTFHVKPRREAGNGVMTAEIWFAPSLQTLPVRILVRQDADSWIDLTLDKPPLQAER